MFTLSTVESSEDEVRPMRSNRRRRSISSDVPEVKRASREVSVEFDGVEDEDHGPVEVHEDEMSEVLSDNENDGVGHDTWTQREMEAGEDAALLAKKRADIEDASREDAVSADGFNKSRRVKRRRSEEEEDMSDSERERGFVPFQVLGFAKVVVVNRRFTSWGKLRNGVRWKSTICCRVWRNITVCRFAQVGEVMWLEAILIV